MIWPILNACVSMVVGLIMAYKLAFMHERFTAVERVGMGMLGAGSILTIGPILWAHGSPYENWAAFLMRVGICLYFVGRILAHDLPRRKW